jgi:hypothetical protein
VAKQKRQKKTAFHVGGMVSLIATVAGVGLMVLSPVSVAAEPHVILANHGAGWVKKGDFSDLSACKLEAGSLSKQFPAAQFGCIGVRAFAAYEAQQAAAQQAGQMLNARDSQNWNRFRDAQATERAQQSEARAQAAAQAAAQAERAEKDREIRRIKGLCSMPSYRYSAECRGFKEAEGVNLYNRLRD